MNSLGTGVVVSRQEFLDLVSGSQAPDSGHQEAACADIAESVATLTVTEPTSGDTATLWMGPAHTTVVSGDDPVTLHRIRTANTPFAVIGLLGLVRESVDDPSTAARMRWWRIRRDGSAEIARAQPVRWEIIDRSPWGSWFVVDDGESTRVERTTVGAIVRLICETLEPVIVAP